LEGLAQTFQASFCDSGTIESKVDLRESNKLTPRILKRDAQEKGLSEGLVSNNQAQDL